MKQYGWMKGQVGVSQILPAGVWVSVDYAALPGKLTEGEKKKKMSAFCKLRIHFILYTIVFMLHAPSA